MRRRAVNHGRGQIAGGIPNAFVQTSTFGGHDIET